MGSINDIGTLATLASVGVLLVFFRRFLSVRYVDGKLDSSETAVVHSAGLLPACITAGVLLVGLAAIALLQPTTEQLRWAYIAGPIVALGGSWSLERGIRALQAHRSAERR